MNASKARNAMRFAAMLATRQIDIEAPAAAASTMLRSFLENKARWWVNRKFQQYQGTDQMKYVIHFQELGSQIGKETCHYYMHII